METTEKKKKVKVYTYHISHQFISKGKKMDMMTQLYKIGVYAIINSDPSLQTGIDPPQMVKMEKDLNKSFASGKITELRYGRAISVYEDKDGFWTEKTEQDVLPS
jgi:hypothetical protein